MGHEYFWILTTEVIEINDVFDEIYEIMQSFVKEAVEPIYPCPDCAPNPKEWACHCWGSGTTCINPNGKCAAWKEGGTWSGLFIDYDPTLDISNYVECECVGKKLRKNAKVKICHVCQGTKRVMKDYKDYEHKTGDKQTVAWLLERWDNNISKKLPYGFVSKDTGWMEPDIFRPGTEEFDAGYYKECQKKQDQFIENYLRGLPEPDKKYISIIDVMN